MRLLLCSNKGKQCSVQEMSLYRGGMGRCEILIPGCFHVKFECLAMRTYQVGPAFVGLRDRYEKCFYTSLSCSYIQPGRWLSGIWVPRPHLSFPSYSCQCVACFNATQASSSALQRAMFSLAPTRPSDWCAFQKSLLRGRKREHLNVHGYLQARLRAGQRQK